MYASCYLCTGSALHGGVLASEAWTGRDDNSACCTIAARLHLLIFLSDVQYIPEAPALCNQLEVKHYHYHHQFEHRVAAHLHRFSQGPAHSQQEGVKDQNLT